MHPRVKSAVGWLLLCSTPAAPAVIDVMPTPIVIRLYGAASLAPDTRSRALVEAARLLRTAGVVAEWAVCPRQLATDGPCARPLAERELVVRIVVDPVPGPRRGELPLGYALIDARTGKGSLATVYVDRVGWLAGEAEHDMPTLLARALVHELGHLLMGSSEHGVGGLMRPIWSREALRRDVEGDWRFKASEIRRIREGMVAQRARRASSVGADD